MSSTLLKKMKWVGVYGMIIFLFIFLSSVIVEGGSYYVDQKCPQTTDTNPGTETQPWKTIKEACKRLKAGDKVLIKEGVYRETIMPLNSGESGAPITFEAYPGHQVMIKGSDIVTGWEKIDNNLWRKAPWTLAFPSLRGEDGFDHVVGNSKYQSASQLEQVFINERPLQWVPSKEYLYREPEGAFFWDYAGQQLLVWHPENDIDLNKELAEVPVRNKLLCAWTDDIPRGTVEAENRGITTLPKINHIHVKGLHFRHSACIWNRAAVRAEGDYWVLEDNKVDYVNAIGYITSSRHTVFRRNIAEYCGQSGFGGGWGQDILLEDNIARFCNSRNFNSGWGGSGMKFALTDGYTIRRNISAFNEGSGIWFDVSCKNTTIEDSITVGNYDAHGAIFYEGCSDGIFRNNIDFGNVKGVWAGYGAGITIAVSTNVRAHENIIISSDDGITICRDSSNGLFSNNLIIYPRVAGICNEHKEPRGITIKGNRVLLGGEASLLSLGEGENASRFSGDNIDQAPSFLKENEVIKNLNDKDRRRLGEALGKVISVVPDYTGKVKTPARLLGIWPFDKKFYTVGYLVKFGNETILLFSSGERKTVGLYYKDILKRKKLPQVWNIDTKYKWQNVPITGSIFNVWVVKGVTLIRGLPDDIKMRKIKKEEVR